MKRPSFQFYPSDWQGNSNLRRCTHEEKGVWMDVMCLLHDQEEYGILRWTLAEIAQAIGCSKQKLQGLVIKGVLKGADAEKCEPLIYVPRSGRKNGTPVILIEEQVGAIWYSSRMVIDEYKRVLRGGEIPTPKATPDLSPKPPIGDDIDDAPKATPNLSPTHAQASHAAPSSSSSTTCKTINQSSADACVPENGKFAIHPDWKPSDHVAGLAKQSGTPLLPSDLPDLISHWLIKPDIKRTQAEWDKALLQTAKHRQLRGASPAPHRKPTADNFAMKDYGMGVNAL